MAKQLNLYVMPNRPCSADAELDRPQDAISENGVAHARGSRCEPCPGAFELAGYHPRSCLGFSPCRALASRDIERGRWRRFRANAHAQRLARTCASVKPDNATQSSKLIIKSPASAVERALTCRMPNLLNSRRQARRSRHVAIPPGNGATMISTCWRMVWLSVASSRQTPRPWKAPACEHFGRHEHRTPTQGYAATREAAMAAFAKSLRGKQKN
jgi:hypothetical protein